jgi:hypothetical protein
VTGLHRGAAGNGRPAHFSAGTEARRPRMPAPRGDQQGLGRKAEKKKKTSFGRRIAAREENLGDESVFGMRGLWRQTTCGPSTASLPPPLLVFTTRPASSACRHSKCLWLQHGYGIQRPVPSRPNSAADKGRVRMAAGLARPIPGTSPSHTNPHRTGSGAGVACRGTRTGPTVRRASRQSSPDWHKKEGQTRLCR